MNGAFKRLCAVISVATFALQSADSSAARPKSIHGVQPDSPRSAYTSQVKPGARTPRFEDFPSTEKFNGKPAAVRLETREARKYRTMIREGATEGPNFAGRYTIVEWGCGAGCVQFAIVDARTGAVFMPPFYVAPRALVEGQTGELEEPLQHKIDSKLLIVSGSRNEKGEGIYYYIWNGKRLVLIRKVASKK